MCPARQLTYLTSESPSNKCEMNALILLERGSIKIQRFHLLRRYHMRPVELVPERSTQKY